MRNVCKKIQHMRDDELRQVMAAVEKRYATAYPEWEVFYIALHKDPKLRQQEITEIQQFFRNQSEKDSGGPILFPYNRGL